ncbi:hypothetical protein RJ55_03814 [Drechmeria coniospora]|nr:hypothetical protein RJ55_03814 [Drechmeria coniospora]
MTVSPEPASQAGEPRPPGSAQTVAVNIVDTPANAGRRFQLGVSECVETKTVTTTTRLTRKFPHVFVRNPTPLASLDSKEYPLATKPTPPELLQFQYSVAGHDLDDHADVADAAALERRPTTSLMKQACTDGATLTPVKKEDLARETPPSASTRPCRQPVSSPSDLYARRTRQTRASLAASPTTATKAAPAPPPTLPPFFRPSHRIARSSHLQAVSDKLRRSLTQAGPSSKGDRTGGGTGNGTGEGIASNDQAGAGAHDDPTRGASGFPATPDASELMASFLDRPPPHLPHQLEPDPFQNSPPESAPSMSLPEACDAQSPVGNVATPPITDADVEPFADADETLPPPPPAQQPPAIDVAAAQDGSLPSPRLSPTLAASQPALAAPDEDAADELPTSVEHRSWMDPARLKRELDSMPMTSRHEFDARRLMRHPGRSDAPVILDTQTLLESFDSMKNEMKTFIMYQFLRRCNRSTLRVIADTVNPALKCDFLRRLPVELGFHMLSYLGCQDLCRAAQVSKQWRHIIDGNETGWKELFDRDGFVLPPGELGKAIVQGWGWQDPEGAAGYERDLSMNDRLKSSDFELTRILRSGVPKSRATKRKRALNSYSASERSKRRLAAQDATPSRLVAAEAEVRQHKSEGPLSAASAAASAVPDPQLGLPSLRQMHLYKSLYRRHYMIRRSWTSGDVKPAHVAFAAHPRHVITCLQFDDDKIITGSDDTLIHIYDTKTGKLRTKLEGHEGGVWALQYEGDILVSGSTDRSVRVWDISRGLCQQVFYGHTSTVRCLQILMPTETGRDATGRRVMQPEKPLIITGSRDSQLRVWRLPEVGSRRYIQTHPPAHESDCPYFIRVLTGHTHSVRAISAHGDTLVSGSYDGTVRVWRINTGDPLHVLRGHSQKVYSVVLDHARNRCISGSMDSLVKIWDLATGACLHTLEGHTLLVGLLDLRDERLVSAAADSTLRIWDPETGRCRNTLMAHTGAITCFQHDGQKVVSGSEKTVKMWDVRNGECVQDLLTDLSGVWQVKFDGRRCVAAVQRDQLTYVEILDFGAVRDGQPAQNLGKRVLLNEHEVRDITDEGAA